MVHLQPASAEAWGLLALLLFCQSRRPARFDAENACVPLTRQDTRQWDRTLLQETEQCLHRAAALRHPGSLQVKAAIQSAHCQRAHTGHTPWRAIAHLHDVLAAQSPTVGARIGQAVAVGETGEPAQGWNCCSRSMQPTWRPTSRTGWPRPMCSACGHVSAARSALSRAIGLTADARARAYLATQDAATVAAARGRGVAAGRRYRPRPLPAPEA